MANRTGKSSGARTKRRGRSRKRRPEPGAQTPVVSQKDLPTARTSAPPRTGFRGALSGAERPRAPWHPWPLSELLIFVGGIGAIVGLQRLGHGGFAHGGPVLLAGLGAVVLGTLEITWREHRTGYRSHALLLALLPVVVFHSAVILLLATFTTVPRLLNVGLLAIDLVLFAVLFRMLRAQYVDVRARGAARRR